LLFCASLEHQSQIQSGFTGPIALKAATPENHQPSACAKHDTPNSVQTAQNQGLRQRDQGVASWIGRQRSEDCFLSVASIVEIQRLDASCPPRPGKASGR
jgi:hypothetical protein